MKNAAFMAVELEDLQETIAAGGATDHYQNGANQSGRKISAALQSYNSLLKNYNGVIKTLLTLLPPGERKTAAAALEPVQRTPDDDEIKHQLEQERAARINAQIQAAAEKQAKERAEAELKKLQAG